MNNMKCFQCVLKHIATALSFGKEIMSGHGLGADLDHRIDFLGELTNLQQHLELIDNDTFIEVKNFRETIQNKKIIVDQTDLQFLRELYLKVQGIQDNTPVSEQKQLSIQSIPNILFLNIKDKNYFDLCYKMLKENLFDYEKIYYLNSDIDLSDYDIEKVNYKDIQSEYIYVMNERDIILKKISCKTIFRITDFKAGFSYKDIVLQTKKNQPYYFYDNFPCIVSKNEFYPYIDKEYPLTYYCNNYKSQMELKPYQITMKLDKVLCCSNKQKVKTALFCYVENQVALNSLKEYFKIS